MAAAAGDPADGGGGDDDTTASSSGSAQLPALQRVSDASPMPRSRARGSLGAFSGASAASVSTSSSGGAAGRQPVSRASVGSVGSVGSNVSMRAAVRKAVVAADIRQTLADLGGSFRGARNLGGKVRSTARNSASPVQLGSPEQAAMLPQVSPLSKGNTPPTVPLAPASTPSAEDPADELDRDDESLGSGVFFATGKQQRKLELRQLFDKYDTNHNGTIEHEEAVAMLQELGLARVNPKSVKSFIQEIDLNNDGTVDFQEFVHMYELLKVQSGTGNDEDIGVEGTFQKRIGDIDDLGRLVAKIKQQKKRFGGDVYATERQIVTRTRINTLLYDLSAWAPDYVYRRWWDVLVLALVMYNVIVPSATVVMRTQPDVPTVILDCTVSAGLLADMWVNMNTAVPQSALSINLETDRVKIGRRYLRRGFFPDVLSSLPFDAVALLVGASIRVWRFCRLARILALGRYSRLFTMTNRGNMDPEYVRFYFWTVPLLQGLFKLSLFFHVLTLGRIVVSPGGWPDEAGSECHDLGQDACVGSPAGQYAYAAFWLWALLTTQGAASLESPWVYGYAALVLVVSLLMQGYVVADMSALVIKSNVKEQINDSMRSTLAILGHYSIPPSLQQEVLSFQYHSLQQNAAASLAETLRRLPTQMQREVGLYVKVDLVTNVPMFRELPPDCRLAVANCLEQADAEPQEFIIRCGAQGNEMFFMMHGFADVILPPPGVLVDPEDDEQLEEGTIVTTVRRGDYFGEVALLLQDQKRTASIQALTYCDLFRLHQADFSQLYEQFDDLSDRMTAEARRRKLLVQDTAEESTLGRPTPVQTPGMTPGNTPYGAVQPRPSMSSSGKVSHFSDLDKVAGDSANSSPQPMFTPPARPLGAKDGLIYSRHQRKSVVGLNVDSDQPGSLDVSRRPRAAPPGRRQSGFGLRPHPGQSMRKMCSARSLRAAAAEAGVSRGASFRGGNRNLANSMGRTTTQDALSQITCCTVDDDMQRLAQHPQLSGATRQLRQFEERLHEVVNSCEEKIEQQVAHEVDAVTGRIEHLEQLVVRALVNLDDEIRKGERFAGGIFGERVDVRWGQPS